MKKTTSFALTNLLLAFTAVSALAQAPSITSGPQDPKGRQNPIVEDGHPLCELNLSVTATGAGPLKYVWKRGSTVVGTDSPTLQITPSTLSLAGIYTCTVSNSSGSVTSATSKVSVVNISDKIFMAAVGQATATVTVTAAAPAGTALAYRWYRRLPGGGTERLTSVHAAKFGGVNTKTLTVKNVAETDAGFYYCQVMANGYSMSSGDCRLIVLPALASKIVEAGGNTELEVMPVGASPSIISQMTYEWKKGSAAIGGATGKTLPFSNVTSADAADYFCVVTLPGLTGVTAPKGRVDVVNSDEVVYLSTEAQKSIKLKVTTSPALGRTFQWFDNLGAPLSDGPRHAGVTSDSLEVKNIQLSDAGGYFCRVTSYGISVDSGIQRLIVVPAPSSKLVKLGDPYQLTFSPAGSTLDVSSRFSYLWKKDNVEVVGVTGTVLDGPASTALTDAAKFTCTLTYTPDSGLPIKIVSPLGYVSVVDPASTNLLISEGKSSTFKLTTTGTNLSYEWFFNGSASPVAASANYADVSKNPIKINLPTMAQGGTYVCRVSAYGQSIDSDPFRLVVLSRPANMLIDTEDELNLTMLSSGAATPGDLGYQWIKGKDVISGANGATLNVPSAQISDAAIYKCVVTYTGGLTTTPLPTEVSVVDRTAASLLGLAGGKASLSVTTRGGGFTYNWYRGNDTVPIAETVGKYKGATKAMLEISALSNADAGDYRCEVTAFGRLVQIGFRTLEIVTTPGNQLIAAGSPVTFEAATTGLIPTLNYVWKKGATNVAGGTGSQLTIPSTVLADNGEYSCVVSIPGGVSVTTGKAALAVASLASFNVNVANGAEAKIKVPALGKSLSYVWSRLDDVTKTPLVEGAKYVGVTKQEVKITGSVAADAGTYVCDITMAGTATTLTTSPISLSVVLPYMSGNFTALIDRSSLLGANNGGRVDLIVATTGSLTGSVFVGSEKLPFTGALAGTNPTTGTASATVSVPRVSGSLTLAFTLGSDNLLTGGTLSNGADTLNFSGWRNIFLPASSATDYAGLYNLGLGLPVGSAAIGDASIPQGTSFASFTVSTKGDFIMIGKTADGQAVSSASFVGPSGQGLLFDMLYDAIGSASILGSFTIDAKGNSTPSDNTLAGTASWNRPSDPSAPSPLLRTYKAGFEPVALAVEGSFYAPPVAPLVFLDLAASTGADNARLIFAGGDIESASTTTLNVLTPRPFRIGALSVVTLPLTAAQAALKLSVVGTKGEFRGDFILKDGTVARPKTLYEGRVYKKGASLVGAGYFLHDRGTAFNILSGGVFMEKL